MTITPSSVLEPRSERRSGTVLAGFLLGLPVAALVLGVILFGPVPEDVRRYVKHPVECVVVVMFCVAVGALAAKWWAARAEQRACRIALLPRWDGRPLPIAQAAALSAEVERLSPWVRRSWIGRRVVAVLDFLTLRGSANDLDDHLRTLVDDDALALDNSYSFTRFLTWAMPILGFLGTVLGITESIAGVTPDKLEGNLSQVTDGLALAFDATALALALTMATMFLSFLVERLEQSVLLQVDRYVERQLAHRFERGTVSTDTAHALREHTSTLAQMVDGVVQRQVELWSQALREAEQRRAEAERPRLEHFTAGLEIVLTRALDNHAERLARLDEQTGEQSALLAERLAHVAVGVAGQLEVIARLQEQDRQLLHVQESLDRNLAVLAGSGAFEQAVESLTAAIHLLTARTTGTPATFRLGPRPGAAA